ncbi:pathogenicity locus [Candidatus Gottesmanbacteria bacterium]|nr:pathogenicity locus [Candidatus Gottesmanbacteria bacterium]
MKNPLLVIPGVGKSIAADLNGIGIHRVSELKGKDPDVLYDLLNKKQGVIIDRCMLYVMRCAVYYASHDVYDPDKLKWWNWKD